MDYELALPTLCCVAGLIFLAGIAPYEAEFSPEADEDFDDYESDAVQENTATDVAAAGV